MHPAIATDIVFICTRNAGLNKLGSAVAWQSLQLEQETCILPDTNQFCGFPDRR